MGKAARNRAQRAQQKQKGAISKKQTVMRRFDRISGRWCDTTDDYVIQWITAPHNCLVLTCRIAADLRGPDLKDLDDEKIRREYPLRVKKWRPEYRIYGNGCLYIKTDDEGIAYEKWQFHKSELAKKVGENELRIHKGKFR